MLERRISETHRKVETFRDGFCKNGGYILLRFTVETVKQQQQQQQQELRLQHTESGVFLETCRKPFCFLVALKPSTCELSKSLMKNV
jgi:hypothetical protein